MVEGNQAVTNRHEILQLLSQWCHDQSSLLCERRLGVRGGGSMEAVRVVSQADLSRMKWPKVTFDVYVSIRAIRPICRAISSGDKTKSMHPLAIALSGMSGWLDVLNFCAMVMPPTSLIPQSAAAPSPS